jgi:chromate reductase, NAD(P)H dehydrogenase (quinone)
MNESSNATPRFEIAAFAGSLRQASFNRALIRAATEAAPSSLHIVVYDLKDLPLYNADVDAAGAPKSVVELRDAVRRADGLLIATPEYNHGMPGVLKNAIDWLSRPARQSVLDGKPAAMMGASPGMTGTARSQEQLRQVFAATNSPLMPQPEVLVARAAEKFDAAGRLTDEPTRAFLATFLERLAAWIGRFAAPRSAG